MKNQLFRIVTRLALLALLFGAFSSFGVHADDATRFNMLAGCDNYYYGTMAFCQSDPNYPSNPSQQDCQWAAHNDYFTCTLGLPEPSFEMDFCANARSARDNCVSAYQATGDFDTYYTCYSASGIGYCE